MRLELCIFYKLQLFAHFEHRVQKSNLSGAPIVMAADSLRKKTFCSSEATPTSISPRPRLPKSWREPFSPSVSSHGSVVPAACPSFAPT